MLSVDGVSYDANCIFEDVEQDFNILSDSDSGRTQDGTMYINVIGTYYGYKLTIKRKASASVASWDALWDVLSAPVSFHTITVPHNQGEISFDAYIASGTRKLERQWHGVNYWGDIEIQFTARVPNLT